ncbi:ATP-binding protein [Miniphocaeibacter halophilus]|uniref:AAA family ATPase n=1 Tax=Miniphocaeibacter halophilus TaxID=2931922 RepID=A0AC61MQX7_9FIRM|nr:ATP-binding protein [Miniphocaeibacter halophilus]QQK07708.1 AAA family ATPase [Miniphocaeibacter halophilus]
MKIIELNIINFGQFKNKNIVFKNNFTILQGKNESGKTTVVKFIEGMFYGFVKPHLKTLRFTDDYYKYKPWTSEKYEGSIIFIYKSKKYRLYRDFINKIYKIFDEKTGLDITREFEEYEESNLSFPGEYFFKCSSDIFINTILVGQDNIEISSNSTKYISEKIADTFSENNEVFSVVKGLNKLNTFKNNIGTEKSLKKPYGILKSREKELNEEIISIKNKKNQYDDYLFELDKKIKEFKKLRNDIDLYNKLEEYNRQQKLLKVVEQKKSLEKEISDLKKQLEEYNRLKLMANDDIEKSEEILEEIKYIQREFNELSKDKKYIYTEYKEIEDKIIYEDKKAFYKNELNKLSKNKKNVFYLVLASGLFSFLTLIFLFISNFQNILVFILFFFLIIFGISIGIILFLNNKEINIIEEINNNFNIKLNKKNILNSDVLETDKYIYEKFEKIKKELDEKDRDIEILLNDEDFKNEELKEISIRIRNKTGFDLSNHLKNRNTFIELEKDLNNKIKELGTINNNYDTRSLNNIIKYEKGFENIKHFNLNNAKSNSDFLIKEIASLEEKKNFLENDVKRLPELIEELSQTEDEIRQTNDYLKSLDIAIKEIEKAHNEIKTNYLPRMVSFLKNYFDLISDYNMTIKIDEDLNINFSNDKIGEFKDVNSLSRGTMDQLYLGLRIALSNEIFNEEEFIIFDDAFNNFDDYRLLKTLKYLKNISENRQIIIFTCQEREKNLLNNLLEKEVIYL